MGGFSLIQYDVSNNLAGKSRLMTVLQDLRCIASNTYQCAYQ